MDESRAADAHPADRVDPAEPGLDSTFDLVERAKRGDRDALDRLFARFLPRCADGPAAACRDGRATSWTPTTSSRKP